METSRVGYPDYVHRWCDFPLNFVRLKERIHNRASSFVMELKCKPWEQLSPDTREQLGSWARHAEQYWTRGSFFQTTIIEAWIWRVLVKQILQPAKGIKKWNGKTWNAYGRLHDVLKGE